ncbi:NUDIX domain-containing protein [Streptomyces sp. NPDC058892]|uniref:NUDIX hydrolase n=1 Tax=unclassified Streptomyces TaxID=2593676 RepID=UPI0036C0F27B
MDSVPEVIEKAAWLCLDSGRLLVARTHGRDAFYLPGGKPEPGESVREALVREVREELGVELLPESVALQFVVEAPAHGGRPGTVVRMACHSAEHVGVPAPHSEIAEVAWLGYGEGDRERLSVAARTVMARLAAQRMVFV